jgi:Secretion system C-terminal sorting domain/Reeler domain
MNFNFIYFTIINFFSMKIKNLLFVFSLLTLWYINTALNPSNPPLQSTGAPGEKTCAQAGCHTGGTQTGTVAFEGIPDQVEPSKAYTITVTCTSAAAKSGGFQLTVLDGANAKSGKLTAGTNQNVATSANKEYVRQSKSGTYTNTKLAYTFTWTAPATSTNKDLTFYTAFILGNGNGKEGGDAVATGTKKTTFKSVATNDPLLEKAITVYPNPAADQLNINLSDNDGAMFTLSNEAGQVLITSKLDSKNSFDVANFARGIYFAKVQVGEKQAVKKVVLQ